MSIVAEARAMLTQKHHEEEKARLEMRRQERIAGEIIDKAKADVLKLIDELADIPKVQLFYSTGGINPVVRIERYDLKKPTLYAYLHLEWAKGKEHDATYNGFVQFRMVDHKHTNLILADDLEGFREDLVKFTADHLLDP